MRLCPRLILVAAACILLPAGVARADLADHISFSGGLSSDIRFVIDNYRGAKPGDGYYFNVNRNDLMLHTEITPLENVVAVIDMRLRFYGLNTASTLPQLTIDRSLTDPSIIQLDQAYVGIRGAPVSWLDLKIGRMVQHWGSADMFNPVDNLNARDFYDPLDYSRKIPNEMLEFDAYPSSWLTLTAVWAPLFQPSILPPSAGLAFAIGRDARGCLRSIPVPPLTRAGNQQLINTFAAVDPCTINISDPQVNMVLPSNGIADSQAAFRAKFNLGDLNMSLSYYYGRFTFPVAYDAVAKAGVSGSQVNVQYTAEVMYPRMHVAGLDFSYSAPWLLNIGFVGELAVIFPEQVSFGLQVFEENAKILQLSSVNVPSTPFVKATFGADYTFTKWLYVNVMYVRGFFDEFNDKNGIHNYVVAAAELKFHDNALQLRLAGVLSADDLSSVAYPQFTWIIVPGMEAILGVFIYGGSTQPRDQYTYMSTSKFGQTAAGRNEAFLKARFTF